LQSLTKGMLNAVPGAYHFLIPIRQISVTVACRESTVCMNRQRFATQESEYLSEAAGQLGWDIHYDQQERGRFAGVVSYAGTDEMQFFHERYNRALCIHGAVPAGMATFVLPARRPIGAASFCGDAITPRTLCAYTPGDQGVLCTPAGHDFINFAFTSERLERALRIRCGRTLADVVPRTTAIATSVESMARLQAAAHAAFVLTPAADEVLDSAAADRAFEDHALSALCAALTDGDSPPHGPLAARNHLRCVRAVRDYIVAHLGGALGIETLCSVSGVSERTLRTAFHALTGLSPQQFIKMRRLTAARHVLTAARRTGMPIKNVARDLGFWHLGHFARDYKVHFGESPSQTLTRQ
jgi:AraC family ethanolamine operon transcriptional activator